MKARVGSREQQVFLSEPNQSEAQSCPEAIAGFSDTSSWDRLTPFTGTEPCGTGNNWQKKKKSGWCQVEIPNNKFSNKSGCFLQRERRVSGVFKRAETRSELPEAPLYLTSAAPATSQAVPEPPLSTSPLQHSHTSTNEMTRHLEIFLRKDSGLPQ